MKETFLLKYDWESVFDDLNDKQAGVLIKLLFDYNKRGEKPDYVSDLEIKMAFKIMSLDCDRFSASYDKRCVTSCENGRSGGAPKGNKNAKKKKGDVIENNLKQPKQPNNLKQPDNDNDNDNVLNPPLIPQRGREEEDEKFDFNSLNPPDDGLIRNFNGLSDFLNKYSFSDEEKKKIIVASNYGQIGHVVWELISQIRGGGIKVPTLFIIKRLGL